MNTAAGPQPDDGADRALGALYGLALGDALGMPTQAMSPAAIEHRFGNVTGFADAPPENPISAGMTAGSVTDDTDQALIVAHLLVEGDGTVPAKRLSEELIAWEQAMRSRGSLDLLGPSTRAALDAVRAGTPGHEAGRYGTTNGAAMRITPVGIAVPATPLTRLLDSVEHACQVTHNTGLGIAAAAAVAAAVSTAVDGGELAECVDAAVNASKAGARRGNWVAGADIATRISAAIDAVRNAATHHAAIEVIRNRIGTSVASQESVPAAFAVLELGGCDPWRTCVLAANLGGDCDTIGAMAGAIAGARAGFAGLPAQVVATLRTVNQLAPEPIAHDLLRLRAATASASR